MLVNTRRLRVRDLNSVQCRRAASQVGAARREKRGAGADHRSKLSGVDPQLRNLCEKFPKTFGRRTDRPENIYHVHSVAVDMLMESIGTMADLDDAVLFEANPGPGVLTRCLLESGVPHLRVFEKNPLFLKELEVALSLDPHLAIALALVDKYTQTSQTCYEMLPILLLDSVVGGAPQMPKFLAFIWVLNKKTFLDRPLKRVRTEVQATKKTPLTPGRFLKFLGGTTATVRYFRDRGKRIGGKKRFLFVSLLYLRSRLWYGDRNASQTAVMMMMLIIVIIIVHLYWQRMCNGQQMHLVHLSPRSDLFDILDPPERLQELVFFIRQNMVKRSAYIIPTLEKWIPGCGPRLIRGGVRVFDRMGDLSPNQVLSVFRLFSSLPEYAHCPFQAAVAREMHPTHDDDHDES
ncbi:unnamed protein product [Ixodes pacificus]